MQGRLGEWLKKVRDLEVQIGHHRIGRREWSLNAEKLVLGRRVSFLRSDWRDESKVGSVTESKVLKIFDQKILDGMVDLSTK